MEGWLHYLALAIATKTFAPTPDGPATDTHNKTHTTTDTIPSTDHKTMANTDKVDAPSPLMEDCKDTLQLMQKANPFCRGISKWLLNGKASSHEVEIFTHIKDLLYKQVMDSNKEMNSWHNKFMIN